MYVRVTSNSGQELCKVLDSYLRPLYKVFPVPQANWWVLKSCNSICLIFDHDMRFNVVGAYITNGIQAAGKGLSLVPVRLQSVVLPARVLAIA
jgi:hypothetical protein